MNKKPKAKHIAGPVYAPRNFADPEKITELSEYLGSTSHPDGKKFDWYEVRGFANLIFRVDGDGNTCSTAYVMEFKPYLMRVLREDICV